MKINTKIFTLIAGLALVLSGCQDDDFGKKYEPAKVGDKIIFGGTSGYAEEGRTQYGEKGNGATPIKWYNGDQVRIYSAEANINGSTDKYSDYAVVEVGSSVSTKLTAINSEASLQWGDAQEHTFYGVYPTPAQLTGNGSDAESSEAGSTLKLEKNVVTGYLPFNQAPWSTNTNNYVQPDGQGNYVIHPAMRYAYMVAMSKAQLSAGAVSLTFRPIVTAVEITLVNQTRDVVDGASGAIKPIKDITAFSITSDNVICGNFTTTINAVTNGNNSENLFTTDVTSTESSYKSVFIPSKIETLEAEKSVTFTAFLMLEDDADLNKLTINIHTGNGVKSGTLKRSDNGIIVQAKKKNFITNVPLNIGSRSETLNGSNWVSFIAPDDKAHVLVKSLSIPGAGGAASKSIYDAENVTYAQQTLTIAEQWNQGIRCFEFAVDRPSSSSTSLGGQTVICAGRETDKTLSQAVTEVKNCLLAHPNEFAMVIITYEQLGGWNGSNNISRNKDSFMGSLNTYWTALAQENWTPTATVNHNNGVGLGLYNPAETTVASAQGKLFCIARPSSAYQDDGPDVQGGRSSKVSYSGISKLSVNSVNANILVIPGWGPLKDKWEARGYTPNVFHRGRHRDNGDVLGWSSFTNKIGRPFDTASLTYNSSGVLTNGNVPILTNYCTTVEGSDGTGKNIEPANFYYSTQLGNATVNTDVAWIQEWARVSPADAYVSGLPEPLVAGTYKVWYWRPSISEKEYRIKECLEFALNDSLASKGVNLYINSLCGYFIDNSIKMSYAPFSHTDRSCGKDWLGRWEEKELTGNDTYAGMEGNIDTYSKYINNYFYNLLIEKKNGGAFDGVNGTGIILMDRVSNDPSKNAAGYYIPQLIWSNNNFGDNNIGSGGGGSGGTTPTSIIID